MAHVLGVKFVKKVFILYDMISKIKAIAVGAVLESKEVAMLRLFQQKLQSTSYNQAASSLR